MDVKYYKCKTCGAPLELSPGSDSVKCAYCKVRYERVSFIEEDLLEEIDQDEALTDEIPEAPEPTREYDPEIEELKKKLSSMDEAMKMIGAMERPGDFVYSDENVKVAVRNAYGREGLDVIRANQEKVQFINKVSFAIIILGMVLTIALSMAFPVMFIFIAMTAALAFASCHLIWKEKYVMKIKSKLGDMRNSVSSELNTLKIKAGMVPGVNKDELRAEIAASGYSGGPFPFDKLYSIGLDSGLCPLCSTKTRTAFLRDGGFGAYCPTCKRGVKEIALELLDKL